MRFQLVALALALLAPAPPARAAIAAQSEAAAEYVCPMLEHPQVFQKPGACPRCGMKLVERSALIRRSAAILVFDGVEIIDYAAPFEVLGQAGFRVFTVGPSKAPVVTAMGQSLVPAYSFDDAPPSGVLVLPGGDVNLDDTSVLDWVRSRTAKAEVALSVCNGAFWLGKAGLLDGLTATTFHRLIDSLQALAPKCHVVRDRRFVDNGKIVTAAGLTSGMDGALHVVDRLLGRDKAREVALNLEYDWRPDSSYARAALADRYLPELALDRALGFEQTRSLGDLDHWRLEGVLRTDEGRETLLGRIGEKISETRADWKAAESPTGSLAWRFSDEQGRPWRAALDLAPRDAPSSYEMSLTLDRLP